MIKFCCAGAALLAVTAGTASLEAHERKPNSFLSLGTHQSETLTYNKAAGDTRSKRTILNSRPHEFGDDIEASDLFSTDAQAENENSPRGFAELYATLHADAYGIRPAGEVPDSLQAEEEDEFGEEASSSRVASLAQLQAKSPRGSGQKGPERQTSGAMSVLRALSRPIMAVGSAAMKATRELRKFLSSPKMSCNLEVEDTKIGGKGSPVVAKALSRLGRVRSTAFLRKVDEELDLFLPRDEEIGYDCVDARQKIVLRRGFPLGAGTFGFVVPFTSNHGAKYAGKLFQVRHGEKATMNNVRKQLSILTYLPPGVDAARASHTLRLGLPLCVVTKRSSPSVMELPTRGTLLNAIVLYPLLRADLSYLTGILLHTRAEDRDVLLSLTQQVVRAVSDLHRLALVHLDIKLQNFLVTEKGSVLTGDLDGAKLFGSPVMPVMFTAAFAAPELAKIVLNNDYTAAAEPTMDSWSLGIAIYGIWCGGYPFSQEFRKLAAAEQMEILYRRPTQTLVYDLECTENMPREVFDLMSKFLKPNPSERLTPIQALTSHPALRLQVPGGEDVRASEEELPFKLPEEEPATLSTASTASTDEAGRPASLSSSYVYVKPEMVAGKRSFAEQDASSTTPNSDGYRFVGSYTRDPKPLDHNRQESSASP